jgi:agmatinase
MVSLFYGAETKDIVRANAYSLGLCWDKSQSFRKGSAKALAIIRDYTSSKLYNSFTEVGVDIRDHWRIYDLGDVKPLSIPDAIPTVKGIIGKLTNSKLNIFFGGDHNITYMSLKALNETFNGSWGLIYFDAHPDLYDSYEGDRYSHARVARRLIDDDVVSPRRTIQIGIRAATAE